ncbi:hypothetical protein [Dickeya phage Sucellus]|nr:hypothetical protein [Dickeya phage Sucellus]
MKSTQRIREIVKSMQDDGVIDSGIKVFVSTIAGRRAQMSIVYGPNATKSEQGQLLYRNVFKNHNSIGTLAFDEIMEILNKTDVNDIRMVDVSSFNGVVEFTGNDGIRYQWCDNKIWKLEKTTWISIHVYVCTKTPTVAQIWNKIVSYS